MSKQLALSSAAATFAMACLAVLGTPDRTAGNPGAAPSSPLEAGMLDPGLFTH